MGGDQGGKQSDVKIVMGGFSAVSTCWAYSQQSLVVKALQWDPGALKPAAQTCTSREDNLSNAFISYVK